MSEKIDRRIQRTRELLRKAIFEMIQRYGYENLTVEQITEHANLGRTTFYLHYRDKKELLLDGLDKRVEELFAEIYSPANLERWEKEGQDPRRLMFLRVAEQAALYRRLFTGEMGGMVLGHFQRHLAQQIEKIIAAWQEKYQLTPPLPNDITSQYTAGALTSLLSWWLENNQLYTPDEIYQMYHHILVHGVVQSSGIGQIIRSEKTTPSTV